MEIRKAVRESDVVVACLSKGSVTKTGYVQKEISFALDIADEQPEGGVFIIPARLEDCETPMRLSKWQWVDLFEDKGYKRLISSLELRAKSLGVVWYLPSDFEPQMIRIPAGKFLMGSTKEQAAQAIKDGTDKNWVEREQPQHTVELSEYFIGKYPITNREYQAFVRDAKYPPPRGWDGDQFSAEKGSHPVVYVSWEDANAYCKWLSEKTSKQYRLPTEAEWEKAARGEDGRVYPWGIEFDPKNANTWEAKIYKTSEVGSFSPQGDSPYGCADMAGNVWEWCNDLIDRNEYKQKLTSAVKDPQGPQEGNGRVLRGGSFRDHSKSARSADRYDAIPSNLGDGYGFRVVSSLLNQ